MSIPSSAFTGRVMCKWSDNEGTHEDSFDVRDLEYVNK